MPGDGAAGGAVLRVLRRAACRAVAREREGDLLAPRSDLPGERKHVSVLFADVTASMAVLTSHDAEEAAALFDQVVEYMVEAVRRWEGTVTQVLGDGIMALFGAPVAQEDHAIRACYAALRMQQRITAYGDEVQRAHGIPILIRVGINSGEVVLRPFGSDSSAISAVGQTVHLASRLEQLAKPGTVLASADTVAMTGRRVRTRALGAVNVKGLAEAVEVFEVVGSVSSTLRAESGRRVPAPLVGREAELARLAERSTRCAGAPRDSSALGGEAGIGKSRLVGDFVETAGRAAPSSSARRRSPTRGPRAGASASTCSGATSASTGTTRPRSCASRSRRRCARSTRRWAPRRAHPVAARRPRGARSVPARGCAEPPPARDSRRTFASSGRRRAASPSSSSSAISSGWTPTRRTPSSSSGAASRHPRSSS